MPRGLHVFFRTSAALGFACAALAFALLAPAGAPAAAGSAGMQAAVPVKQAPPVLDDLLARDGVAAARLPVGLGALPSARETAAFAAGKVAVAVIFLESDGSRMRSTEDWSREDPRRPGDRRALVLAQVQSALDWWNAQSPDGSLELFMPAAGSYGAPQTLETGYEPIRMPVRIGWKGRSISSDTAWRWEVMDQLHIRHDATDDDPKPETAFADKVRTRNHADWAFVLYVVDSLKDTDGMFANGVVAYTADLFGPYTMLTYDNDGYGFANFGAVLAHEMGHIFGALDEYPPPVAGYPSTGGLRSGYLGVLNGNAEQGGRTHYDCIMRGSQQTVDSFRYGGLCRWTQGQTGLRDSDRDSRPDVVDTKPALKTGLETTTEDGSVTLLGSVTEQPRRRGRISGGVYFRRDLSILVPHDAQYRVDGGDWLPLAATDGAFGEASEGWKLTTEPLAPGHHELELQATTGEAAGLTRSLWAGDTPVDLELATDVAFTRTGVTVKAGKRARIYVRSTSGGLPVARLSPVRLVRLADGRVMTRLTTGEDGVWTGTLKPGHTRTYEVRFAGAGQFLGPVASPRITVTVR
jgi:hypothetical protein